MGFGGASGDETIELPAFEEVKTDRRAFAEMTRHLHHETNPKNARRLIQRHGDRMLVVNPPAFSLSEAEMDRIHELPYTRRPHPSYHSDALSADVRPLSAVASVSWSRCRGHR